MAKVVLNRQEPLIFGSPSFLIFDHKIIQDVIYYTYRVNLRAIDIKFSLSVPFEIRITQEAPFVSRPNMFKNKSVSSARGFNSLIEDYSKQRIEDFRKKTAVLYRVILTRQDIKNGFIDFEMPGNDIDKFFANIVRVDNNTQEKGALVLVDNKQLIETYSMPTSDFVIGTAPTFRNKIRVAITPKDKRISKFKIQQRSIPGNSHQKLTNIVPIVSKVGSDGIAYFDFINTASNIKNFRIMPISFISNRINSHYKDLDINKELIYNDQVIIYPNKRKGEKISFNIRSIPNNVLRVYLLRKNLTKKEKNYKVIDSTVPYQSFSILRDDKTLIYDVVEYSVKLEFRDGTQKRSSATYVLNPQYLQTAVSLVVKQELISSIDSMIKFDVSFSYNKKTSTQSLLDDLKTLGIDSIFPNEIKNLSTQLEPILGVLVSKINLASCVEENLGIYKKGKIDLHYDKTTPCVYIFEVVAKTAVEMIEDIGTSRDFTAVENSENSIDIYTASRALGIGNVDRRANFTQKFFSQSALYSGTLKYGKTLSSTMAGIESGRTGIVKSIYIEPVYETPTIEFLNVEHRLIDKIVSWSATKLNDVDHFSIIDISDQNNVQEIGKSFVDSAQAVYEFVVSNNVKKITIAAVGISNLQASIEADV